MQRFRIAAGAALVPLAAAAAAALAPADIVLETDPAVTVRIERRVGNTSKNVYVTVNKQDRVTVKKKCGPQPPDKTRVNVCALPAFGEWTSTSSSIPVAGGCWTDGAWSPSQPPDGACVVPPPTLPPPPPPIDMTKTVFIDQAKIPTTVATGSPLLIVRPTTEIAPAGDGAFRTTCNVVKFAFDDPIVFPGKTGLSHLHTFFGNTGADANSTAESLRTTGNSTCRGGIANRSAYWVPTMIDTKDGTPLVPTSIGPYYKAGKLAADAANVQPMPVGLRMIAGTPSASGPTPELSSRFKCIGGPNKENDKYGSTIGNCDVGAHLVSEVFFPQCWDGVNLDSPNHKSHMSYTVLVKQADGTSKRACPATHPVALPEVTFNVEYLVTEKDAPLRWRLASDNYDKTLPGGYSSHGDWYNGWQKDISDAWAKNCIQAKKDCHSHLLGDGRMLTF